MSDFPAASANTALQAVLTGTMFLSLHTADPGTTGANEVAGGSYARQSLTFAAASGGSKVSNNTQTFSGMPSVPGGVQFIGVWTAASAGTFLWGGPASGSATGAITAGSTVTATSSITGSMS